MAIFPFFVPKVFLVVVIQHPLLVRCHQVVPTLCRFKIPVSHAPLYINYVELTRGPAPWTPAEEQGPSDSLRILGDLVAGKPFAG